MIVRLPRNPMYAFAALALSGSIALSQQAPPPASAPPGATASGAAASGAAPVERRPPSNRMRSRNMPPGPMMNRSNSNFRGASQMRGRNNFRGGPGSSFRRPQAGGMGGGSRIAPEGMWWRNPSVVQRLTLTADQTKKMDGIFQESRLQLIDLKANVEKQEVTLEPLLSANPLDSTRAMAQIDKVADARADLEKANAKMLLGIRAVLTPDQWTKLHDRTGRTDAQPAPGGIPNAGGAPAGPAGGRARGPRGGGPPPNANNLIDPIDQM